MIGLCDCNNFFVSCERVFRPDLERRPVVVLSNNDGCIIARSNESKALGIKMGQPLYQVRHIIQQYKVTIFSSNYNLYGDMSKRVFQTVKEKVPSIEIYSIDEAFIDFSGIATEESVRIARELVRTIRRNTGIPVSIGISPTKTLAKIASKLCKQYPKLEGVCLLHRPEDITKVLSKFPIEDVWGIGRRYSKMLHTCGVKNAEEFRALPEEWVLSRMSIVGVRTWRELHGTRSIEFDDRESDKKSIMVSRSFAKELTTSAELQESLTTFIAQAATRLRKQQSVASEMQIFIATNRHREDKPQHHASEVIRFGIATDSTLDMVKEGIKLLHQIFRNGYEYKKAGVLLSNIQSKKNLQIGLFDDVEHIKKQDAIMQTIDSITQRFGNSALVVGTQTTTSASKSNSNHRSPEYTTKWSDIITVKI
ncbi:MAG: Y-family DNA polymerase [bacterium]